MSRLQVDINILIFHMNMWGIIQFQQLKSFLILLNFQNLCLKSCITFFDIFHTFT